ncbi:uncharacterized protein LOC131323851 [Rhododendron vialii]|uniref:uncharacterized protein LOC131323851 n=1 Tax=Rhododendron vialii TaxID=182163 RepID=UPI00265E4491|nr:uncharacterized protein LOC131323851 [Rhododendron vialii]
MNRWLSPNSPTTSSLVSSSSSTSRNSTSSSNLEYLYEFEYLPDDSKVPLTDLPFLNPYNAFVRPQTSVKKTVTQLFSTKCPTSVKESELLKLLPEKWVTAFENNQHQPIPVQSSNPLFETKPVGTVEISFPREASASPATHPVIFPSRIDMFVDGSKPEPPIKYFQSSGLPVFYFKHPETGHCYFDACNCDECSEESFLDDDDESDNPCPICPQSPQSTPIPCKSPPSPKLPSKNDPSAQPSGCFMFTPSPSFTDADFPPLEYHNPQERTTHRHKILDSTTIHPDAPVTSTSSRPTDPPSNPNSKAPQLMVQPVVSPSNNPISTLLHTLATMPETPSPEPTIESDSDIESTDSIPTPHVFMMNPENPEEDVEDPPIIEEDPDYAFSKCYTK